MFHCIVLIINQQCVSWSWLLTGFWVC